MQSSKLKKKRQIMEEPKLTAKIIFRKMQVIWRNKKNKKKKKTLLGERLGKS